MENKEQNPPFDDSMNRKHEPGEDQNDQPDDLFSGEDILNKIEKDAVENTTEEEHAGEEHREGNDLLSKLGLSKKDKLKKKMES